MRLTRFPLIACALAAANLATTSPALAQPVTLVVDIAPAHGALPDLLQQHATEAKRGKLVPVVELGMPECPPCTVVAESLDIPRMKDAFAGVYLIRLNVHEWSGQLRPQGFEGNIYPVFYALGDGGRPDGRKIDGNAWGENTPENMAPPLKAFFAGLK